MKRLAVLLLLFMLFVGCTSLREPGPAASNPAAPRPEPAAAGAKDAPMRPIETGHFTWERDTARVCAYDQTGPGAWWIHAAPLALPGLDGAAVRFCQWRGESVQAPWGVYARVDRGITRLYASPRLGDELNWYDVVTHPNQPGFALVVGLINHAGERQWTASAAAVSYSGKEFDQVHFVGAGIFGGTALSADRTRLHTWQGQHPTGMEGVVINCMLCPQHMTVTQYTWGDRWDPKPGAEVRTRLTYLPGTREAVRELPVNPRALEVHAQGLALMQAGDLEKARNTLAAAFSLDPTFADAAADQGHACVLEQKWTEALVPLGEALKVDPLHPAARFDTALALARLGHYREAREHAIHAVLLQPGREQPRALYEEIRRAMGS